MAGVRAHGLHLQNISLGALAAGTGSDAGEGVAIHAFADQSAAAAGDAMAVFDRAAYQLTEANFFTYTALTGQATNFASICLQHRTGTTVNNDIRVVFSAAGVVTVAYTLVNLNAASGATVTGAGTGTLTVQTGTALPWTVVPGDTIVINRISNNATGLATPAISLTFALQSVGA